MDITVNFPPINNVCDQLTFKASNGENYERLLEKNIASWSNHYQTHVVLGVTHDIIIQKASSTTLSVFIKPKPST